MTTLKTHGEKLAFLIARLSSTETQPLMIVGAGATGKTAALNAALSVTDSIVVVFNDGEDAQWHLSRSLAARHHVGKHILFVRFQYGEVEELLARELNAEVVFFEADPAFPCGTAR